MDESDPQASGFSRGDLDRVIRRAAELQFEEGAEREEGPRLDESEIRRIGREVGIDERYLERAIGELRAEQLLPVVHEDGGPARRFVGDASVRAHRVVPGSMDGVEPMLGEHLEVAETLSPVRSRRGRSLWEPSRGALAGIRRGMRWRGYRYELARVSRLQVSVLAMEDGFVLVDLVADLDRARMGAAVGGTAGGATAGVGVGLGIGLLVGLPFLAVPGAVVGGVGGVALARSLLRRQSERVRLTLEGILDRLESGKQLARKSLPGPWAERLRG